VNAHKAANTMARTMNMRVVCARSGLGMLVNMRWNMMPALENRLGRFLYFEHLYGFCVTAIGADEGPKFRVASFCPAARQTQ